MEYTHDLILFCKSYYKDVHRVKVLLESITQYNKDGIPFYLCIPKKDLSIFQEVLGEGTYQIVFDEDLTTDTNTQSHFTQQLFKMEFYKTGIASNYFTMDSDMYFIRDFHATDFITKEGVPYFTIHECKDLLEYSEVITGDGRLREWFAGERDKIMQVFGREGRHYDYSGSAILYISSVFQELYDNYCVPNELTFLDLLNFSASENNWYGEYMLFSGKQYYPCGPLFKTFHYPWQYSHAKDLGITEQILSQNYLGITMQSNWNAPLRF